ncbi:MAG: chorismate mutase [Desulfurococcales archaeon]|nr:chorismate mutase [Desulfurococcales archaeon]
MLRLYRRRLEVCREIGRVKRLLGIPLEDEAREAEVLGRAGDAWEKLLLSIVVEACKSVQREVSVGSGWGGD